MITSEFTLLRHSLLLSNEFTHYRMFKATTPIAFKQDITKSSYVVLSGYYEFVDEFPCIELAESEWHKFDCKFRVKSSRDYLFYVNSSHIIYKKEDYYV